MPTVRSILLGLLLAAALLAAALPAAAQWPRSVFVELGSATW